MPVFDYTSRDYGTIKTDLIARAERILPDWSTRDPSDFGMVLVDLWAQMGDVLHYYVDRAAGESFLTTATQNESILAYANLFDYAPSGRNSARGTLVLNNSGASAVTIPAYTRFVARYDDKTYQVYTPDTIDIPANSNETLTVYEGTIVNAPAETLTLSSTGQAGQRYRLSNIGVVKSSVVVTVYEDGVTPTEYRQVTRIADTVPGDRVYTLRTNSAGYVQVEFGTQSRGFIPPANAKITAIYAYSSGSSGNLPANSITGFRSTTPENITIVSSTALTGGVDAESIASMKASIPSVISSQNRAVTLADYTALALSVEGVSKAAVQFTPNPAGGASAGNASVTVYPHIDRSADYLTTTDTSQTVSETLQSLVVSSLQPRSVIGVDVVCASSIAWQSIDIEVTVHVSDTAVALYVKNAVEAAIDRIFTYSNVVFGQTMSLGQLYRAIINNAGVNYAVVDLFDEAGSTGTQTTIQIGDYALPKKGTVNVTVVGGITST